ncbi:unnamed protein product [Ambrosiozyma monospora]|uniref:Unnamed protein product n=1 Tax=Ambrosiozyma monospora TaxID=43982 RepID=A0ACB5SUU5_AMBMO|nr:unnamed protein product [Ambrosiozyma monospora]
MDNGRTTVIPYGGKIGGLTFHRDFESKLFHLDPTKMTFLTDDGDDTALGCLYLFFNCDSKHLPYFKIQFDTEFAPAFIEEHPKPLEGEEPINAHVNPYHCVYYWFQYPQQQLLFPFHVYSACDNADFWLDYPSYSNTLPKARWYLPEDHFNYPLRQPARDH